MSKSWQTHVAEALASAMRNRPRDAAEERRVEEWLEERRVANGHPPTPRPKETPVPPSRTVTCCRCKREVREAEMGYRYAFTVTRRGAKLEKGPTKMCADCDEKARERGSELGQTNRGRSYGERLRDGFATLAGVDVADRYDRLDREFDEVMGR